MTDEQKEDVIESLSPAWKSLRDSFKAQRDTYIRVLHIGVDGQISTPKNLCAFDEAFSANYGRLLDVIIQCAGH